jgi:hypothetical protein
MGEARARDQWAHTSLILALIANCNRDPKKTEPFTPADFNPFIKRPKPTLEKADFSLLKTLFVDSKRG